MSTITASTSHPTISQPVLREILGSLLRIDSDFMAFCADNFAEAHKKFSDTMDRTQKTTLLLNLIDHADIFRSLHRQFGDKVSSYAPASRDPELATDRASRKLSVATDLDDRDRRAIGQEILAQTAILLAGAAAELEVTLPHAGRARITVNKVLLRDASYTRQLVFLFEMLDTLEEKIQFLTRQKELPQAQFVNLEPEIRERKRQISEKLGELKDVLLALVSQYRLL